MCHPGFGQIQSCGRAVPLYQSCGLQYGRNGPEKAMVWSVVEISEGVWIQVDVKLLQSQVWRTGLPCLVVEFFWLKLVTGVVEEPLFYLVVTGAAGTRRHRHLRCRLRSNGVGVVLESGREGTEASTCEAYIRSNKPASYTGRRENCT